VSIRIPTERDPRSPWLVGIREIAGYAGMGEGQITELLHSGEMRGHQRKPGAKWRVRTDWVDAYFEQAS
jgi:excisionase family DNA binding protein